MNYEFRVWKDQKKMPDSFKAEEAKGRITKIISALNEDTTKYGNPDILIDSDGEDQSPITSAEVLFELAEIKNPDADDDDDEAAKTIVRTVKMNIKGNLYLPLNPDDLSDAVAGYVGQGSKGDENKLRDTLLLSKWAEEEEPVLANAQPGYYRGVLLSVLTKAGDFRLISANNMYVVNYTEDYTEGEFGTFELQLAQKIDAQSKFKVDGLSGEKKSVIGQIAGALKSTAETVVEVGSKVAEVGGTAIIMGTEVAEKFTGETEVTKRLKHSANIAKDVGSVTKGGMDTVKTLKSGASKKDKADAALNWINDASDKTNDEIKAGKDVYNRTPSLAELEAQDLDYIKADPEAYEEYINMTDAEKKAKLKEVSEKKSKGAATTKSSQLAYLLELKRLKEEREKQKKDEEQSS